MATLQTLIAHYLATSYPSALPSFLSATGEPAPDTSHPPDPDLRTLAQDYLSHQLAKQLEGVKIEKKQDGSWEGWTARDVMGVEAPRRVLRIGEGEAGRGQGRGRGRKIEGLSVGNLLGVQVGMIPKRWFDTSTASYRVEYRKSLLVTSVDKTLSIVDYETGQVTDILEPHKSSILCFAQHPTKPRYLLTGSMDGTTILTDLITSRPIQTFKSTKFVVRVAFSPCGRYMATASYDKCVVLYRVSAGEFEGAVATQGASRNDGSGMDQDEDAEDEDMLDALDDTDDPSLACDPALRYEEIHRVRVDYNPESILFIPPQPSPPPPLPLPPPLSHPQPSATADATAPDAPADPTSPASSAGTAGWLLYTTRSSHLLQYLCPLTLSTRSKSFNAHPLDTHVSFSVLNMVLHPSGRVVACQTGDGMAGERVLFYGAHPDETERLGCIWTGAETDPYVLPRMAFTSDGSAVITTSPNGYLHYLPLKGGMASLKVHGNGVDGDADGGGGSRGVGGAMGGGGEVIRDVCVIAGVRGDTGDQGDGGHRGDGRDVVVSVGYDRVVRFTEVVNA